MTDDIPQPNAETLTESVEPTPPESSVNEPAATVPETAAPLEPMNVPVDSELQSETATEIAVLETETRETASMLSESNEDLPDEPVPVPDSPGSNEPGMNPDSESSDPTTAAEPSSKKRWYVVKVQSNREESIKAAIERKVRIEGLEEFFGQIIIPVERHQELRRGKRVTKTTKLYPGYLFAEVEFNDRILYLFRETSGVGDFVGGGVGKPPTPMPDKEVERMLHRAAEPPKEVGASEEGTPEKVPAREVVRVRQRFSVGDRLRVIDGNFSGMEGEVVDLPEDKVKVVVSILGRPLSLDLEYWQVEAI